METEVASLLLFLVFGFFMFQAGYVWRDWPGRNEDGRIGDGGSVFQRDDRLRDGMVGKI
jgi:hypothetical protein